jgi:predicted nucleic acid-binding protein
MKLAFDTSFLVAAVLDRHPHHARTRPWTRGATQGQLEAQVTWHAAAETWSVLTRLPGGLRLAPASASLVLERLLGAFHPVEISAATYRAAMLRCTERGLRSGALFDALHLSAAESSNVSGFVTFNEDDFLRLRSATSPQILVPPDPPAAPPRMAQA